MVTPDQWSRGDTIRNNSPHVSRLGNLYAERDELGRNKGATRRDWLAMARQFTAANAPLAAKACRKMAEKIGA